MDDCFCVYIHVFPNGKVYVGQTKQKPEARWANGAGYKGQFVGRAINKYGWENIKHKIVQDGLSLQEANDLEMRLISDYQSNRAENGYNIAGGGSANAKGLKKSEEHKRKIAESHYKPIWCYNRNGTLVREYESQMQAAKDMGGSFRVISACCHGEKKSAYGFIWRFAGEPFAKYETQNKKGGVKGNPVIVFTEDGEEIGAFKSAKAASIATGVREDAIGFVCKGKIPSKHGLIFRYYNAGEKIDGEP